MPVEVRDAGTPAGDDEAVISERVCDHGHGAVTPWSDAWDEECWFGHPITTGIATCTCPGSGREK